MGWLRSFAERFTGLTHDNRVLFQDRPYQYDDWEVSRSWKRYVEGMRPDITLRVAVGIWPVLLVNFLISVAVCCVAEYGRWDAIDDKTAVGYPFTLTLFAVSLLLVFKTNSAYSRWWEGRKIWGIVYNEVRAFTRKVMTWIPDEPHADTKQMLVRWMVAFPYLVNAHLDPQRPLRPVMVLLLHEHEIDWLEQSGHYFLAAAHLLSTLVAGLGLHPYLQLGLEQHITKLVDVSGGCERIQRQAIPRAYTRHTTRFLSIWIHLLPIALWSHIQWATVAVGPLIAFLLLGLEHIGAQLENPFLVLSQDVFCLTIHKNVLVGLEAQDVGEGGVGSVVGDVIAKSRTMVDNRCPPPPQPKGQQLSSFASQYITLHSKMASKKTSSVMGSVINMDLKWFGDEDEAPSSPTAQPNIGPTAPLTPMSLTSPREPIPETSPVPSPTRGVRESHSFGLPLPPV